MPLILPKPNEGGGDFTPAPQGNHFATCYRIIDLGTQEVRYEGKPPKFQPKILIGWELPNCPDEQNQPLIASKRYTLSTSEKATLRQHLESWRGVRFTDAEFGTFDLGILIGANCFLNVLHQPKGDKVYTNIASVTAIPNGINLPKKQAPINPPMYFSIDTCTAEQFQSLSNGLQEVIARSPEFQQRFGQSSAPAPAPRPAAAPQGYNYNGPLPAQPRAPSPAPAPRPGAYVPTPAPTPPPMAPGAQQYQSPQAAPAPQYDERNPPPHDDDNLVGDGPSYDPGGGSFGGGGASGSW